MAKTYVCVACKHISYFQTPEIVESILYGLFVAANFSRLFHQPVPNLKRPKTLISDYECEHLLKGEQKETQSSQNPRVFACILEISTCRLTKTDFLVLLLLLLLALLLSQASIDTARERLISFLIDSLSFFFKFSIALGPMSVCKSNIQNKNTKSTKQKRYSKKKK